MRCAREVLALSLALVGGVSSAELPPLRMAIDNATQMPMARLVGDRVEAGMNHELGAMLAERMGRRIEYLALPRKRLEAALQAGGVDMVCTYQPEWLPAPALQWSQAFFPQSDVLITRADVAPVRQLSALAGEPIGTVLGFVYPRLDRALGAGLRRDDAPSAEANLRKLAAGRLHHAVVEQRLLRHLQRSGAFSTAIHPPRVLDTQRTRCALAPNARVSRAELDAAITRADRDGALAALYRRYD